MKFTQRKNGKLKADINVKFCLDVDLIAFAVTSEITEDEYNKIINANKITKTLVQRCLKEHLLSNGDAKIANCHISETCYELSDPEAALEEITNLIKDLYNIN